MGHAILNILIGLVDKTLTMSFLKRIFKDQWHQKKNDLIEGIQQLTWYPETSL